MGFTLSVFVNGLENTQIIFDGHERLDEEPTLRPADREFDLIADIINNEIATEIALEYEKLFCTSSGVTRENVATLMNEMLCRVMEQFYQSENAYLSDPSQYIDAYIEFNEHDEIVNEITLFLKERLPINERMPNE